MRAAVRVAARAAAVLWLAALPLVGGAGAAAAHGRGSDATNFRSTILSAPVAGGLRWRVLGGDAQLELDNRGPRDVVVLGLQGEPYLRIGPRGVFENRRSPTVPLQRARYAVPDMDDMEPGGPQADPDAAPDWVRVSVTPRWAWHDHRIHWMSPRTPDVAGETVLIPRWEVPVLVGGAPAVVTGELRWIPAPSPLPWLGAGLLVALAALWGLRRPRHDDGTSWPAAVRPAAVVLALAALLNVVHLADDAVAAGPPGARAGAAVQTLLYLGLALGGAWRARRGDYAGVTALAIGSGALFLGQGLLYLPVLTASQISHGAPDSLLRLAIGAGLAQLGPVGFVAWRVGRVVQPDQAAAEPRAS